MAGPLVFERAERPDGGATVVVGRTGGGATHGAALDRARATRLCVHVRCWCIGERSYK